MKFYKIFPMFLSIFLFPSLFATFKPMHHYNPARGQKTLEPKETCNLCYETYDRDNIVRMPCCFAGKNLMCFECFAKLSAQHIFKRESFRCPFCKQMPLFSEKFLLFIRQRAAYKAEFLRCIDKQKEEIESSHQIVELFTTIFL
jgi:hypothetical protein